MDATPSEVLLSFFLDDQTSARDVFSSSSFILSDDQLLWLRDITS